MEKLTNLVDQIYESTHNKSIWSSSKWKNIEKICINDVGKIGEMLISGMCDEAGVPSNINGKCGNIGDGIVKKNSVEIKTARLNNNSTTFQHELGEFPWKSEFMIFIDICPYKIFITIFPNFSKEFYKKSGKDSKIKCFPVFKSKSICWRKLSGNFKLDTSIKMNEENEKYSYIVDENHTPESFKRFIDRVLK